MSKYTFDCQIEKSYPEDPIPFQVRVSAEDDVVAREILESIISTTSVTSKISKVED